MTEFDSRRRDRPRGIFYILVPVITIIAMLGIAEIVLRNLPRKEAQYFYKTSGSMFDYAAGPENVRLKPSTATTMATPEFDVVQVTNAHGFRDYEYPKAKPTGFRRIAVIGDSITFGAGVQGEQTFAKLLERRLAAQPLGDGAAFTQVMNLGVGSYDTGQELLTARRALAEFDADIIVLAHYANDFQAWPHRQDGNGLPSDYRVSSTEWRAKRPDSAPSAPKSSASTWIDDLAKDWALAKLVRNFLADLAKAAGPKEYTLGDPWNDPFWPFRAKDYASKPEWQLSLRYVLAMGEETRKQGRQFVFVTIPSGVQVNGIEWDAGRLAHYFAAEETVTDAPQKDLRDMMQAKGFMTVEALPALRAQSRKRSRMFYAYDGHLTPAGNEAVAAVLEQALRQLASGNTSFTPAAPAPGPDLALLQTIRPMPQATLTAENGIPRVVTPQQQYGYAAALPVPALPGKARVTLLADVESGRIQIGVLNKAKNGWLVQSSCLDAGQEHTVTLAFMAPESSEVMISNCGKTPGIAATFSLLRASFESQ